MKILNRKIGLGESVQIKMDFARLNTRSKIEVPIIVERGKKPGPCILLIGGIHGDETNGVERKNANHCNNSYGYIDNNKNGHLLGLCFWQGR